MQVLFIFLSHLVLSSVKLWIIIFIEKNYTGQLLFLLIYIVNYKLFN